MDNPIKAIVETIVFTLIVIAAVGFSIGVVKGCAEIASSHTVIIHHAPK